MEIFNILYTVTVPRKCAVYVGVGGMPVCSGIAALNRYRTGIYLYVCYTRNRISIIP